MAQTSLTRQELLEHGAAIFKMVLREDPDIIQRMHATLEAYIMNGTEGTVAKRREGVRCVFNYHWKECLHQPYNGHAMKHCYEANQDVPDLEEPLA